MRGQGNPATKLATGLISIGGVPPEANIAAAFLYWASLEPNGTLPMSTSGYFRGQPISGKMIGPATRVPGCWGSGGGSGVSSASTQVRVYRADILKNFAVSEDPATLGKLVVNDTFEIKLPDSGSGGTQSPSSGNQVFYVEGASLVVVYSLAAATPTTPLRSVVLYDGAVTIDQDIPTYKLNVGGYYDAIDGASGKMTHLVADGGSRPEILTIDGAAFGGSNPFSGALGSAWDSKPYEFAGVGDLGVSTEVSFPTTNIDCLSWAGVILRTDVQDKDKDGIPDLVEEGKAAVPDGEPALPDFPAMGAHNGTPDLFVELGFFKSAGWPTGGVGAHDHRPTANALAMMGKAFKRQGINVHFDVGRGDTGNFLYPAALSPTSATCANLATWTLGCAIVPTCSPGITDCPANTATAQARGGELVTERACGLDPTEPCQFPNNPGTVGWKSGYQYYRDAPVAANGAELTLTAQQEKDLEAACEADAGACPARRRFDANRMDFFHYSLWAHALGLPSAADAHTPARSSGFADVGGGDTLITLGGFGGTSYNGSDIAQAGTFMHELGHNLGRRHGGESLERNCKPNYISVMSYLFQVHGMNAGTAVDFSGQVLNSLDESVLADGALTVVGAPGVAPAYATRWYAPLDTSFVQNSLIIPAAAKHCDGSTVLAAERPMVRVDGTTASESIDWLNNGVLSSSIITPPVDVNFDGNLNPESPGATAAPDGPLNGANDWAHILSSGLRQLASRPNMGLTSLEMSVTDLGRGDPGRGDPGSGDPGRGDPGRGDPGRGDPGRGDPGRGDPGRGDPGAPPDQGDLTLDHANAIFNGPYSLTATKVARTVSLTWLPPHLNLPGVQIVSTTAFRVQGATITPENWAKRVQVGQAFGTATTIIDTKPLSNKLATYIVVVDFSTPGSLLLTRSGVSNRVTILYP